MLLVLALAAGKAADARPRRPPQPPAATTPAATPAPPTAAAIAIDPADGPAMLARLAGHQARLVDGRLIVDDVAGEGRPWVGVIERHGAELWLRTDDGPLRLAGPLARPRIAGPGYRAWATGSVTDALTPGGPPTLRLRRLGILARPLVGVTSRALGPPSRGATDHGLDR